ncbi:hypothetical protein [Spirosoma sp. 48-14]|uniref:hypothetical protein n=1 Tax=Spirosoma sp. 48-14 TaxID=1895854 RepID=UPI0025E6AFF0|nr:hypothetical protein [Spirosoma sp. 48-14]
MNQIEPKVPEPVGSTQPLIVKPEPPTLVQVDQSQLMAIVGQRDQYHQSISQVIWALPVLASELPKIKWMSLVSQLGMNPMSLFSKKKKDVSSEQLNAVLEQLMTDHPHLREPLTILIQFWISYKDINHGIIAQPQQ